MSLGKQTSLLYDNDYNTFLPKRTFHDAFMMLQYAGYAQEMRPGIPISNPISH